MSTPDLYPLRRSFDYAGIIETGYDNMEFGRQLVAATLTNHDTALDKLYIALNTL